MGDLQESLSPCFSSTTFSYSFDLCPLSIDPELWLMAEQRTQEILWIIQPASASEKKRKDVIDYIRRLIKDYYATEVFPFGSVPLKTYLPDGDIDLTALSYQNMEEDLAWEVYNILKYEEKHPKSEVKDVQYIQAQKLKELPMELAFNIHLLQVKVVKCSVKNILVDISFNQMEGLCALCFLEQVDQLIGKDHLLKHSIILIKAWCFYESRILGAHHGLMSTYALEILVLHIIMMFHSSMPGPLAVLYRFLDYYSTFDWENYCVSFTGPVKISSLSEIGADSLDNNGNQLLISPETLKKCKERFMLPIKAVENGEHKFLIKHLNILDPLKETNNLGRSVSKGNFHRIKCALSYGAQKLREVLLLPGESMGAKLEKFFVNTLDRNGRGERPDIQVPVHAFGTGRYEVSDLSGDYDNYYSGLIRGQLFHNYSLLVPPQVSPPPSQIQQNAWYTPSQILRCKQHVFPQRGTTVFVPRVPLWHSYVSPLCATTSGIDELGKSRGTGTYIPDVSHHPYKGMLSWMRVRNSGSLTHGRVKSPLKGKEVENDTETKKSDSGCCLGLSLDQFKPGTEQNENICHTNLSPDQFPLLPCLTKSMSTEINQSSLTELRSLQVEECSSSLADIKFGTWTHPTLSLTRKQANAGVSTTLEIIPAIPKVGMLQKKGSQATNTIITLGKS